MVVVVALVAGWERVQVNSEEVGTRTSIVCVRKWASERLFVYDF